MRSTTSERLLVVQRKQHHDYDALVTVFSLSRGRFTLLAKGLFKPQAKLAGHLEPLTLVDALIVWGQRPLLSSAVSRQSFGYLKNNLLAIVLASQILNRYQAWCPVQESWPRAWQDLISLLTDWNQPNRSANDLQAGWQAIHWRLAQSAGYCPDLSQCQSCQQALKTGWWSYQQANIFCPTCQPNEAGQWLSKEVIDRCQAMLGDDWLELTKQSLSPTILESMTSFFKAWLNFLDYQIC